MYRYYGNGGNTLKSIGNSMAHGFNDFKAGFIWVTSGAWMIEFTSSIQKAINSSQLDLIYSVFSKSEALQFLIGIVTVLGIFMIAVRIAWVISQSYNVNIENQKSVPAEEYIRRIVYALVTLALGPAVIVNGFILVTVLALSFGGAGKGNVIYLSDLLQDEHVSRIVDYKTYCYDGQKATYSKSIPKQSVMKDQNASSGKFVILGDPSDIGDALPLSAKSYKLTDADVKKLNNAFCRGGTVEEDSDIGGNLPGWKVTEANGYSYTVKGTNKEDTEIYPRRILESLSYDTGSAGKLKNTFGNAENYKEPYEAAYGDKTSLTAGAGKVTRSIMTVVFFVLQAFFFLGIIKDLFERIVDIFGAIFSLWMYAPAYVSAQRNNMISELVKKVSAIYLTHMYTILLIELWMRIVLSSPKTGMLSGIVFEIGITYGIMKAMKKGNTSMQQFFDKSSSGDIISGAGKTMSEMAKSAASGG